MSAGGADAGQADRTDRRAELMLGALSAVVLLLIAFMIVFVFSKAWPSFSHNGLAWFGPGGNVDEQLTAIFNSPSNPSQYVYALHAWPLLYATALITGAAVFLATAISLLSAMFIVEFAPAWLAGILQPVIRLLAAVPSVIYGLIGLLVLVPFVGNQVISGAEKESVQFVIQLDGTSVLVGVLVLTVMITPIMVAIVSDALRSVPRGWTEGAAALGVNRWRALRTVGLRAARPAIVAAAVLATARALGEAIMLSMVSGSVGFAPNPLDGVTFFFEPARTLAATIVDHADELSVTPSGQTIYAFAAILLISSAFLSFAGWAARRSMRKYTLQAH
ncbi:MAG TPA: ABC transporter permease subunit [Solirubrobacterales bacterium]|nr:ABC transporter permease subunit [Solirubrobacterales bacterium]